jgi:cytochrome b
LNRKILVWDLPVRLFHWTLAAAFIGAYVLSESERWRLVHVTLGYTVLALVLFRVVWGFLGTRYARFASFAYGPGAALRYITDVARRRPAHFIGHNPAGSWAVYLMLALAVGTGVTGWLQYNDIGGELFEEIHEVLGNAWLVVVLIHVAGVIASSLAHRENLARTMVTGMKEARADEPPAEGSRALVAVLLLIVLGAVWAGSIATAPNGSLLAAPGADGDAAGRARGHSDNHAEPRHDGRDHDEDD